MCTRLQGVTFHNVFSFQFNDLASQNGAFAAGYIVTTQSISMRHLTVRDLPNGEPPSRASKACVIVR